MTMLLTVARQYLPASLEVVKEMVSVKVQYLPSTRGSAQGLGSLFVVRLIRERNGGNDSNRSMVTSPWAVRRRKVMIRDISTHRIERVTVLTGTPLQGPSVSDGVRCGIVGFAAGPERV